MAKVFFRSLFDSRARKCDTPAMTRVFLAKILRVQEFSKCGGEIGAHERGGIPRRDGQNSDVAPLTRLTRFSTNPVRAGMSVIGAADISLTAQCDSIDPQETSRLPIGTIAGASTWWAKELFMATEPKRQEPDIPPQKPDIQPEPRPEEIPQDKDFPEKEAPPMQL